MAAVEAGTVGAAVAGEVTAEVMVQTIVLAEKSLPPPNRESRYLSLARRSTQDNVNYVT